MKAVIQLSTKRPAYREQPPPDDATYLQNAAQFLDIDPNDMAVLDISPQEWQDELDRRQAEREPTLEDRVTELERRVREIGAALNS